MNQMKNEQMVVMIQMDQLQGTHKVDRNGGPLPKHIQEVSLRYKDVFNNDLPQELSPKTKVDRKIKVIPRSEPPSKPLHQLNNKN